MGRRNRGISISLDSFLDILTCVMGALMLVIISTGIDAAQTKVLIPTPIERHSDKRPIYIECRNNILYPVAVDELWKMTQDKMTEVNRIAQGDNLRTLQLISSDAFKVTNEFFEVDITYAFLGQLALKPNRHSDAKGFELEEQPLLSSDNYMTRLLRSMDKDKEKLMLIVRDDSYKSFKSAQRLAFLSGVEVSVEVFDAQEPIKFSRISFF